MNSMSKNYYNDDNDPCPKPKHKECKTILKCGCPGSATIPAGTTPGSTSAVTVTSLSLNTSCLCDPCIKLEFASTLAYASTTGTTTLNFQVYKLCENQLTPLPVGPQWTFSSGSTISLTSTFTFFVCDCNACTHECCTYTVVATPAATGGSVALTNATLSAIATDNNCRCC